MGRILRTAFLIASVAFLAIAFVKTVHRLPGGSLNPRLGSALAAAACIAVGSSLAAIVWRRLLRGFGVELPTTEALRINALSQPGKYVPGGFWQPLGHLSLARAAGIGGGVASVSIVMTMALTLAAALVVGPIALVASGVAGSFVWLLLLVPVAVAALHPRVMRPMLTFAARLARRPGLAVDAVAFRDVAAGLVTALPIWLVQGLGVTLAARSLAIQADWLLLTGAFSVAWAVGFLALPFPGGLGVREGVLLLLLNSSPAFGASDALAFAITVRLLTIVVEAALAGVAFAIPRRVAGAPAAAGRET